MQFNKLRLFLEKKYNCECFVNLDSYLTLPITQIYTDLSAIKKDNYAVNDRLFFYTLTPTNKDLVFHLQKTISALGIPNYFVKIISNQTDIVRLLTQAQRQYVPDQDPITVMPCTDQSIAQPAQSTNFNIPDTICVNPWINLFLNTDGSANPCCIYSDRTQQLNINTQSFDEIMNSQPLKDLRKQLLEGEKAAGCRICWDEEVYNKQSKRLRDNYVFKDALGMIDWNQIDNLALQSLDIKLGNICNLACRICSPDQSTTVNNQVKNNVQLQSFYKPINLNTNWVQNSNSTFWNDMKSAKDSLTYVQFEGGEPLLVKRHFEILKFYVAENTAKNMCLHYNTNGTIFLADRIPLWNQFKHVEFTLSIDNLGKKFEYERYGASWDAVCANILEYAKLDRSKFTINVSCTLSALNLANAYDLYVFFKNLNIPIEYNILNQPADMSINVLTQDAKKYILSKIGNTEDSEFRNKIDPVIKQLLNNNNNLLDRFINRTQTVDELRQQKFSDVYPELYNFLRKQ
jgi:MoaA/NifB/PqqE/SkfB family radical SAM enzyme